MRLAISSFFSSKAKWPASSRWISASGRSRLKASAPGAMNEGSFRPMVDRLRQMIEGVRIRRWWRGITLTEAWEVRCDQMIVCGEQGNECIELARGGGKPVQQHERRRVLRAGFPIEERDQRLARPQPREELEFSPLCSFYLGQFNVFEIEQIDRRLLSAPFSVHALLWWNRGHIVG
jgi:hypothetical protein